MFRKLGHVVKCVMFNFCLSCSFENPSATSIDTPTSESATQQSEGSGAYHSKGAVASTAKTTDESPNFVVDTFTATEVGIKTAEDLVGEYKMTFELLDKSKERDVGVRSGCHVRIKKLESGEVILFGCGAGAVQIGEDGTFSIDNYLYVWRGKFGRGAFDTCDYLFGSLTFLHVEGSDFEFIAESELGYGGWGMRIVAGVWAQRNQVCWPMNWDHVRTKSPRVRVKVNLQRVGPQFSPLPVLKDQLEGVYRVKAESSYNRGRIEPENIECRVQVRKDAKNRYKVRAIDKPCFNGYVKPFKDAYDCSVLKETQTLRWDIVTAAKNGDTLEGKIRTPRVSSQPDVYQAEGYLAESPYWQYYLFTFTKETATTHTYGRAN